MLARHPGEEVLLRSASIALPCRNLVGGACTENAEVFRQHDEPCAFRRRGRHQRARLRQIRGDVTARNRLHRSDPHSFAHFASASLPVVADEGAAATRPLTRATTGSSHEPVTR